MNASKQKGTAFESGVRMYLRWALDDQNIDRAPLHSTSDIGDISGVHIGRTKIVVECKSRKHVSIAEGLAEAETEAHNLGTPLSMAVFKLDGQGTTTMQGMAGQLAVMDYETWDTFNRMGRDRRGPAYPGLVLLDIDVFSTMKRLKDSISEMERMRVVDGLLAWVNHYTGRVVITTLEHAASVINLKRPLGPKQEGV